MDICRKHFFTKEDKKKCTYVRKFIRKCVKCREYIKQTMTNFTGGNLYYNSKGNVSSFILWENVDGGYHMWVSDPGKYPDYMNLFFFDIKENSKNILQIMNDMTEICSSHNLEYIIFHPSTFEEYTIFKNINFFIYNHYFIHDYYDVRDIEAIEMRFYLDQNKNTEMINKFGQYNIDIYPENSIYKKILDCNYASKKDSGE